MRLRKFRVRAYRCIHDSGEIRVGDLAAFVGRNESGKTTILQALTLLNKEQQISELDLCDELSEELKSEVSLVEGDFEAESIQVINNIEAVLNHSGSDLSDIVKITVYLTDLSLFPRLNKVFEKFFKNDPPARSAVEVSALPMQVRVEMEAIALKK